MEKIKEKENRLKKKQEELKKNLEDEVYQIFCQSGISVKYASVAVSKLLFFRLQVEELTPEEKLAEKLRVQKLQEESDMELTNDAFGEDRFYLEQLGCLWGEAFIHVFVFQVSAALQTVSRASMP